MRSWSPILQDGSLLVMPDPIAERGTLSAILNWSQLVTMSAPPRDRR